MTDLAVFYRKAVEKLGFRQEAYRQAFGREGSPANLALVDLADFTGAFNDESQAGLSDAEVRERHGMRRAFFRIWKNLKLNNAEMELVARSALVRAAARLAAEDGDRS